MAHPHVMSQTFPIRSLATLREAEVACTRCPLYRNATQVVPGEGRANARLMLVGEQPGDQEDFAGRPFVDLQAVTSIAPWRKRASIAATSS
jgi:uracil-DNA glycosylase